MPAFKFEALDAAGKATSGLLEAESPKAARSQLRAQALVPLAVTQVVTAGIGPTGQICRFSMTYHGMSGESRRRNLQARLSPRRSPSA